MLWRPSFAHGLGTLELSLPVGLWRHAVSSVGSRRHAAAGTPAASRTKRRDVLMVPLRFYEAEWPDVLEMLAWGQTKAPMTWTLSADEESGELASAEVWLDSPRVGDTYAPEPDPDYPRVLVLEVALRRIGGEPWNLEYFPLEPAAAVVAVPSTSPLRLGEAEQPFDILVTDDGAVVVADGHVLIE